MQINLVTGYTGEAHIKSEDDALLNSFLAGQDNAVINLESEFNDTDCDISCDALVGGRLTRTDEAVNLTFTKPSSGYYRYDGVYIVYKKVTSGIESAELVYCEGTENASQATAEQNIGQPTISADVVASSVLQLYTVAWDNAQTKTVTASVVEGSEVESMGGAFFNDGETVSGACYCAGVVVVDGSWGYVNLTLPLPKSLRSGQQITTPEFGNDTRIYFRDGTNFYDEGQLLAEVTGFRNNWCNLKIRINDDVPTAAKLGPCTALVNYDLIITR